MLKRTNYWFSPLYALGNAHSATGKPSLYCAGYLRGRFCHAQTFFAAGDHPATRLLPAPAEGGMLLPSPRCAHLRSTPFPLPWTCTYADDTMTLDGLPRGGLWRPFTADDYALALLYSGLLLTCAVGSAMAGSFGRYVAFKPAHR